MTLDYLFCILGNWCPKVCIFETNDWVSSDAALALLCFATDSSSKLLYWLIQKVLEQKRSLLALLSYCRFGDRAINYEKLLPKPRSISWMEASRFLKIAWRQLGL